MIINFPANCTNEASRWSFCTKLNEKLRIWHNGECAGLSASQAEVWRKSNFYPRINAVMFERNNQIEIARQGAYWNPKVPDHVSNGVINYPGNLNQSNEGSRASFLFGLEEKLRGRDQGDVDVESVTGAIAQAKEDAINATIWNPSLGVIS